MIYLASPYSHPDEAVRLARTEAVTLKAAELFVEGKMCFSPIVHGHALHSTGLNLPTDYEFWKQFNDWFIERCDKMVVYCLEDWDKSRGIIYEVKLALSLGKPVEYILP